MGTIKLIKLGPTGYPDIYRGSEKRRFGDLSGIDQTIIINSSLKRFKYYLDQIKWKFNNFSKFNFTKKKKKNLEILYFHFKSRILKLEKKFQNFKKFQNSTIFSIGNLIHNSNIFSETELFVRIEHSTNNILRIKCDSFCSHVNLLKKIQAIDYKRGISVSGNRGYFLKSLGILLNFSIIRYGLDYLSKKRYISLQTPYFMKNNLLKKCTQLSDFSEQLYSINNTNKFLIATSEQPISAFHYSEKIPYLKLPLKYAGFSTCFRKEGGSHGKDTSGIFRVHQFEKVEQFIIGTTDFNSWKLFDEMLENSKNFYQSLNIPCILVNIPSSSINLSASKKIDILGFFPGSKTFRELVSCSNCTTHQSRKLKVEFKKNLGIKEDMSVTMLNSTLCATTRLICCICENYQNRKGITVPVALRSYMGVSFLPFFD